MKNIALTGPFNNRIKNIIYNTLPDGFEIIEVPDESKFQMLSHAQYILIRTLQLSRSTIDKYMGKVKLIQKWGAGYDMIDVSAATEAGITVAISSGTNSTSVAEMAVLHILALYRKILLLNADLKKGIWSKDSYSGDCYVIEGKTVGIIGIGNIGSRVAKIMNGFGAKVVYYDTRPLSLFDEDKLGIKSLSFEELLRSSDIVSLHIPLKEETKNMINKKTLALMKSSAILINTSRGQIVNEKDLIDALKNNRILGAGLDTFEFEPLPGDSPLHRIDNIVLTPHAAGNTFDSSINQAKRCMDNILKFERGEPLPDRDIVNYLSIVRKND